MFRPSRSSTGPPRKQFQELFSLPALWDPRRSKVSITEAKVYRLYNLNWLCDGSIYTRLYTFASVTETCEHLGSHNADKLNNSAICFLGGPEDDQLGRNMSP